MYRRTKPEFVQLRKGLDHDPRVGVNLGIERGYNHVDCDHGWHDGHDSWDSGPLLRVGFLCA
jgi:hypothetical protein